MSRSNWLAFSVVGPLAEVELAKTTFCESLRKAAVLISGVRERKMLG
jgi:hypothetical protein